MDRLAVVQSPLFKQAQKRFRELQHREAAAFSEAVRQQERAFPSGDYLMKVERAEAV